MDQKENSAVIALLWEKRKFPFKVEVDLVNTQLDSYRRELTGEKGFRNEAWGEAIQFCIDRKVNLDEALQWSDYTLNGPFFGVKNFSNYQLRSDILNAQNKTAEADSAMKEAVALGAEVELHQYARQLLRDGNKTGAIEVFKLNAKKHPNTFTTNMGLVRAYSASGDYKNALKYIKTAQTQAPDQVNKDQIAKMIPVLESGKDIN